MPKCDFNKVAMHIHDCTDMNRFIILTFLPHTRFSNEAKSPRNKLKVIRVHMSTNKPKRYCGF